MSSDPTPGEPRDGASTPEEPPDGAPTPEEHRDGDSRAEATPCHHTEYVDGAPREEYPATGADAVGREADVWAALAAIEDPEMPISIVNLGLIYGVDVEGDHATVEMTLTYTGCPARRYLTDEVKDRVADVEGVESVDLELVWSPPWTVEMVTEQGRAQLREFGLSI